MTDSDRHAASGPKTAPRFDNWPIERHGGYTEWPVERATPADEEVRDPDSQPELVGFGQTGGYVQQPYVYEPHTGSIVAARLDEDRERIVVEGERDSRETDEVDEADETDLAERIEAFGEEHDWAWLSSFAREYLERHDHAEGDAGHRTVDAPEPEASEFDRRNLADSASADLAFAASHTFSDADDRVFVLERDLAVDREDGGAAVEVDETLLAAEPPRETSRVGDAAVVDERAYAFDVDVDPVPSWDASVEATLREWHDEHVGVVA